MATVGDAIKENDVVELRGAVGRWPTGTRGTAVSDYGDVKLIEIADERGRTRDLIRVDERQLKRLSRESRPS
jgi:hypothetical protein